MKKIEKEINKRLVKNKNPSDTSKLIQSDDYSNKIKRTNEKFPNRIAEKDSKLGKDLKVNKKEVDIKKAKFRNKILELKENENFKKAKHLEHIDTNKENIENFYEENIIREKLSTDDVVETISNKEYGYEDKSLKSELANINNKRKIFTAKTLDDNKKYSEKINKKKSKLYKNSSDKDNENRNNEEISKVSKNKNAIKRFNSTYETNEINYTNTNSETKSIDSKIKSEKESNLAEKSVSDNKNEINHKEQNKINDKKRRVKEENKKYTRDKRNDEVKDFLKDKKLERYENKKDKLLKNKVSNKNISNKLLSVGSKSTLLAKEYLSNGSEDNAGVESGEKVFGASSKLQHGVQQHNISKRRKQKKKLDKLEFNINKRKSKLEFREEVNKLKKSDEYLKSKTRNKFYQRKRMKNRIYQKYETRFRDRVKKSFMNILKVSREYVARKSKALLFFILGILAIFTCLFSFGASSMSGLSNTTSSIMTTTYLSDKDVLQNINQEFSNLEYGLQDKIENIKEYYPGYDEYVINKNEEIFHDTHELLSYITSRCGVVKNVSETKGILKELFDKMYDLEITEKKEIRYRTVTKVVYDADGTGRVVRVRESYEYKKLIVTLNKKEMDEIIRKEFSDYPNNLVHYEALLSYKGNMGDVFGSGNGDLSEIVDNPDFSNPGIAFDDATTKRLFAEAEKHIGKRYVFGANGPNNFDCSSFVCWSFTKSGIKNMPRTTAWLIYKNYCNPISPSEAKPGDIIFFKGTYNSGSPISHVGIYAGNGMMIHAGDPIQYTSINSNYWKQHFYGFGRPR